MNAFQKLIPKKSPAVQLPIIGVAGSAGKTSVIELIRHVSQTYGLPLSTLSHSGAWHGLLQDKTALYRLDKKSMYSFISQAQKSGSQGVIVEIDTARAIAGVYNEIQFDTLAFPSLGFDHGFSTIDEMFKIYTKLASQLKHQGMLIINQSDENFTDLVRVLEDTLKHDVFAYMVTTDNAWSQRFSSNGTSFMLFNSIPIETKLTGTHSVINIQIAIQILSRYIDMEGIRNSLLSAKNPRGRLDRFQESPFHLFIDTARQPHTLENALYFLQNIKSPKAKLITVIGSSIENKAFNQRIGQIAHAFSDIAILTSLDPNNSSVYTINSHIHNNLEKSGSIMVERFNSSEEFTLTNKRNFVNRILNVLSNNAKPFIAFDLNHFTGRLDAIKLATSLAQPGDIVFISGKGDDTSTVYNNVEYEWSDYEAVRLMSGI